MLKRTHIPLALSSHKCVRVVKWKDSLRCCDLSFSPFSRDVHAAVGGSVQNRCEVARGDPSRTPPVARVPVSAGRRAALWPLSRERPACSAPFILTRALRTAGGKALRGPEHASAGRAARRPAERGDTSPASGCPDGHPSLRLLLQSGRLPAHRRRAEDPAPEGRQRCPAAAL